MHLRIGTGILGILKSIDVSYFESVNIATHLSAEAGYTSVASEINNSRSLTATSSKM